MYKIKIINYKPYEYELFQNQLDQLGQQGYKTSDLSFVSIFQKENHPVYYQIDFSTQVGRTRREKRHIQDAFCQPYIDKDYQPIYAKKGMYVFVGEEKPHSHINWQDKKDFINGGTRFRSFVYLAITLLLTAGLITGFFTYLTIDSFLSYGLVSAYVGIFLICLTMIFRQSSNTYHTQKFHRLLEHGDHHFDISKLKRLKKIYNILAILCLILVLGGLGEDVFNRQEISIQDHPTLTMKDLGMNQKSDISLHHQSSFVIPNSYTALEMVKDDILYIKEYHFHSQNAASQLFEDYKDDPKLYSCTTVKQDNNVLYGYTDQTLTALIIQKEKRIVLVSVSFTLNPQQIQSIIQYYS